MKTIELTTAEFHKKVADLNADPNMWEYLGDKPCIVDFYASCCGPCKALAPVLDELAEEYKDKVYFYKVNTENEEQLAAMFAIRSVPTLLFCPMKQEPQMAQGVLPKATLKDIINRVLLK